MARPSNEELMEERRAVAEILKPEGEETNVEAARRVIEARDVSALAFSQTLEFLAEILQPVGQEGLVEAAQRIVEQLEEIKTSGEVLAGLVDSITPPATTDDDPADPRPAMDPVLGWRTPAVEAWVARRNQNPA